MNELDSNNTGVITATNDVFYLQGNSVAGGEAIKAELKIESAVNVVSKNCCNRC